MKVGQVLSTIDFAALPEDEREEFKQTLAQLRDDVPPLPFKRLEKLLREELGEKPSAVFAEFEEEAFAAASIGQVHRAVTLEGRPVAVKVQYPGVAEAVETDLRNLSLLLPLVRRLAPGLDVKALYAELRERIAEELDYELEAQHQRAVSRAHRDHPFAYVPEVFTELSSRRVLVTELIEGARFEEVKRRDEATRDRVGEIVFRFYFGLVHYMRRVSGDPHPGNYLLLDDGRIGFLDFGLMRVLDEAHMERENAVALAMDRHDPQALHAALTAGGYLPEPDTFDPDDLFAQISGHGRLVPRAGRAPLQPEVRRRPARRHERPAIAVLRPDAPPDAAAGLAADAADGGPRALDAGRAARERRLERDLPRVLRGGAGVDAAGRGRARLLGAQPQPALHHPDGLRRLVDQQEAAAELRRDRAERARPRERVQAQVARRARRPAPCGARRPPASASDSPSSPARSGRRSCATRCRSGACPRSRCSGVTRPGRHVRLAVDGLGVEVVAARLADVDEDRVVLGRPAGARLGAVVVGPDDLVEEALAAEELVEQQLAVVRLAVVDVEVQRAVGREQAADLAQARLEEREVVVERVAVGGLLQQPARVPPPAEAGPVAVRVRRRGQRPPRLVAAPC